MPATVIPNRTSFRFPKAASGSVVGERRPESARQRNRGSPQLAASLATNSPGSTTDEIPGVIRIGPDYGEAPVRAPPNGTHGMQRQLGTSAVRFQAAEAGPR